MNPNQKYIDAWASKFQDDIKKAYMDQLVYGAGFLRVTNGKLEYCSLQDVAEHVQLIKDRLNKGEKSE